MNRLALRGNQRHSLSLRERSRVRAAGSAFHRITSACFRQQRVLYQLRIALSSDPDRTLLKWLNRVDPSTGRGLESLARVLSKDRFQLKAIARLKTGPSNLGSSISRSAKKSRRRYRRNSSSRHQGKLTGPARGVRPSIGDRERPANLGISQRRSARNFGLSACDSEPFNNWGQRSPPKQAPFARGRDYSQSRDTPP